MQGTEQALYTRSVSTKPTQLHQSVERTESKKEARKAARVRRVAFDAHEDIAPEPDEDADDELYESDDINGDGLWDEHSRRIEDEMFLRGNAIGYAIDYDKVPTIRLAAAMGVELYNTYFLIRAVEEGSYITVEALLHKSKEENLKFLTPVAFDLVQRTCRGHRLEILELLLQLGMEVPKDSGDCLIEAVETDEVSFLNVLLNAGVEGKSEGSGEAKPMFAAAIRGNIEMMQVLLDHGVCINEVRGSSSALTLTIGHGHVEALKFVLKQGVDTDGATIGGIPLLLDAVTHSSIDMVKLLIESNIGSIVPGCFTVARGRGDREIISYLLDQGADIDERDSEGLPALCIAAVRNYVSITKLLLARGVNVDETSRCGCTALQHACMHANGSIVYALIKAGADLWTLDSKNRSCLHRAVIRNSLCCAKIIVRGAQSRGVELDLNQHETETGQTVLHTATEHGHSEMVDFLARLPGIEIDALDMVQRTPLLNAARLGLLDTVKSLVDAGAKLNLVDAAGVTPIYAAMQNGHEHVVAYFRELIAEAETT